MNLLLILVVLERLRPGECLVTDVAVRSVWSETVSSKGKDGSASEEQCFCSLLINGCAAISGSSNSSSRGLYPYLVNIFSNNGGG